MLNNTVFLLVFECPNFLAYRALPIDTFVKLNLCLVKSH